MKVLNSKELFFGSKEQFQQLRLEWKAFHKDGKHLKVTKETWDGHKYKESDLHCVHHLIYALLRGKDISKMFVPNNKVEGRDPYFAFYEARDTIVAAPESRYPDRYDYLFVPFGGTVDMELLKLVAHEVKGMRL